jgi:hypothetical protein
MSAECAGEFTVYKKGRLYRTHPNPAKSLISFSHFGPKAHRPIYRDMSAQVHY